MNKCGKTIKYLQLKYVLTFPSLIYLYNVIFNSYLELSLIYLYNVIFNSYLELTLISFRANIYLNI